MAKKTTLTESEFALFQQLVAEKQAADAAAKAQADADAAAAVEAANRAAAAQVESAAKAVKKGRIVTVVRGKKIPLGGMFLCVWIGMTKYGQRAGIEACDEQGNPTDIGPDGKPVRLWTAVGNLDAIADLSAGCDAAVAQRVDAARSAEQAVLDSLGGEAGIKGTKVRIRSTGITGTVRWCRGTRIGISVSSTRPLVFEYIGRVDVLSS